MTGRKQFTSEEAAKIRRLLSSPNLTQPMRRKLRNLGFYITDWVGVRDGFNVSDFEDLILGGQITIEVESPARSPDIP